MFKYELFLHTNSQGYLWVKKKKPRHKGTSKTTSYLKKFSMPTCMLIKPLILLSTLPGYIKTLIINDIQNGMPCREKKKPYLTKNFRHKLVLSQTTRYLNLGFALARKTWQ